MGSNEVIDAEFVSNPAEQHSLQDENVFEAFAQLCDAVEAPMRQFKPDVADKIRAAGVSARTVNASIDKGSEAAQSLGASLKTIAAKGKVFYEKAKDVAEKINKARPDPVMRRSF